MITTGNDLNLIFYEHSWCAALYKRIILNFLLTFYQTTILDRSQLRIMYTVAIKAAFCVHFKGVAVRSASKTH